MGMLRRRRLIASLATLSLVGEMLAIGVHGTLASYNSQAVNKTTMASFGTLTLATGTVTSGGQLTGRFCLSSGGTATASENSETKCGPLSISGGPFFPGTFTSVRLRLENTGSLNAGGLSVWAPHTCTGTTTGITLCSQLELTIQETTSTGASVKCYYPTTNTTCTPTSGQTLEAFSTYTGTGPSSKLVLTGGLPALSSRFFTIGLTFPTYSTPTAGNPYQDKTAKFSFSWYATETGP